VVWLTLAFVPVAAVGEPRDAEGFPVRIDDVELFRIRHDLGPLSAEDRARLIQEKLHDLTFNPFRPAGAYELRELDGRTDLVFHDQTITTITNDDAAAEGVTRHELAAQRLALVQDAVETRRAVLWHPRLLAIGLLYTVLFSVAFFAAVRFLSRRSGRTIAALEHGAPLPLGLGRLDRITRLDVRHRLARLFRFVRVTVGVLMAVVYGLVVLSFFPRTSYVVDQITTALGGVFSALWADVTGYLPSLLFVLVVAALAYVCIRLIKFLFVEVERGTIQLPGFDADWAMPTYRIAAFATFALALVVAFPYLPGANTEAFKGVSLFLGAIISLASTSAIANIVSGVILTYTKAFRVGDRVRIADTAGDIVEKTLLVTRVRTPKNVDIAVPNALVLGSHIINYSRVARDTGVILHTSVTIGYEAPWRTVHELLVAAALGTADVEHDPAPFVLQTSLEDFYVTYEINVYTRNPWRMALIYSELHTKIQDAFNEAGVEIMSPHFSALRDGNRTAIPDPYLPEAYKPSPFRFLSEDAKRKASSGADGA
jgi:small-conductance mechanosensitive channel